MAWFNLGRVLDKKGWSMRRFAGELGVKPQVITRYFKPGFDPNGSTVLRWAQILQCKSLDELLDDSLDDEDKHMPRPKTAETHSVKTATKKPIKRQAKRKKS